MLLPTKKTTLKTITFRMDEKIINDFRELCKKYDYKQVAIIENAMKKAIEELKKMEKENDR